MLCHSPCSLLHGHKRDGERERLREIGRKEDNEEEKGSVGQREGGREGALDRGMEGERERWTEGGRDRALDRGRDG